MKPFLVTSLVFGCALAAPGWATEPAPPPSPDVIYGSLFADVQRAGIFPDQKTFPDCVARGDPEQIVVAYAALAERTPTALRAFVDQHFLIPETPTVPLPQTSSLPEHLRKLWDVLRRAPDRALPGSSLLPLPEPYIVPGGRFREVYYWDSYFTLLGLRETGHEDLIASMVGNFAFQVRTYGLIPNGNRTYYLSRSQPPFFALMVELLAERQGARAYREYLPALRAEYDYWMDRTADTRHVVRMAEGVVLNRYYDRRDTPRPEAWLRDETVAAGSGRDRPVVYRELRSAAESGWDFSSRWFEDGRRIETIATTDVVPIDLNALLWQLERTLGHASEIAGDPAEARRFNEAAARRQRALAELCWSKEEGWFCDYRTSRAGRSPALSLAGVVPLFVGCATPTQAAAMATTLRERFLRPGGLVTTLVETGEQWDAPNGWAPLQWMAIRGLANYGHHELAADIARRWIALNREVYDRTGRMLEKYDVEHLGRPGGGGEYPTQDGFGWTNGVLLTLLRMYPAPEQAGASAPPIAAARR